MSLFNELLIVILVERVLPQNHGYCRRYFAAQFGRSCRSSGSIKGTLACSWLQVIFWFTQDKLNISDAQLAPAAMAMPVGIPGAAAAGGDAAADEPVVEKTEFDVKLASYDDKSKIKVIKEVRAVTSLGLKEVRVDYHCITYYFRRTSTTWNFL